MAAPPGPAYARIKSKCRRCCSLDRSSPTATLLAFEIGWRWETCVCTYLICCHGAWGYFFNFDMPAGAASSPWPGASRFLWIGHCVMNSESYISCQPTARKSTALQHARASDRRSLQCPSCAHASMHVQIWSSSFSVLVVCRAVPPLLTAACAMSLPPLTDRLAPIRPVAALFIDFGRRPRSITLPTPRRPCWIRAKGRTPRAA